MQRGSPPASRTHRPEWHVGTQPNKPVGCQWDQRNDRGDVEQPSRCNRSVSSEPKALFPPHSVVATRYTTRHNRSPRASRANEIADAIGQLTCIRGIGRPTDEPASLGNRLDGKVGRQDAGNVKPGFAITSRQQQQRQGCDCRAHQRGGREIALDNMRRQRSSGQAAPAEFHRAKAAATTGRAIHREAEARIDRTVRTRSSTNRLRSFGIQRSIRVATIVASNPRPALHIGIMVTAASNTPKTGNRDRYCKRRQRRPTSIPPVPSRPRARRHESDTDHCR